MRARLRAEDGLGLVELTVAMTLLSVALLALVAAFSSGAIALRRDSRLSTAASIADAQMERYRSLPYGSIALDANALASVDSTYLCDSALGSSCPNSSAGEVTTSGSGLPSWTQPTRVVAGADRASYRVDTYVVPTTPPSGRADKLVTVVVRDALRPGVTLVREASAFDLATGS